ncbi:MAG TPA: hypothetical protein VF244_00330 [Acidimicrobiales bacterium]
MLFVFGALATVVSGVLPGTRLTPAAALGPVTLSTFGTAYTQDFNTLVASGSATWLNDSTILGWFHARTGNGTSIAASNGGSATGSLYSFGTGTGPDRALGSVGSGNIAVGTIYWGVRLYNGTGGAIGSLDVAYTGEQWRNSGAAAQAVPFSYLVGSPTVTGSLAEFQTPAVHVSALDFTSPVTGGSASALDGNLAANRTTKSVTITGLNIPNGTEVMLRWTDNDHIGADHGLSVDDFSVTPHAADTTAPTCSYTVVTTPPVHIDFTVQDTGSGLAGISVPTAVNIVVPVPIPSFTVGVTTAVNFTATKDDQSRRSQIAVVLTDVAGNQSSCI